MKQGVSKTLWLISGIVLIFAGVLAIIAPTSIILSLTIVFGLAMLITGLAEIGIYVFARSAMYGVGWLLANGILTALLGLFVMCNQVVTETIIPYIFGLWVVFSGVLRLVDGLDLKKFGVKGWFWMALVGAACILLGFISFIRPVIAINIIGVMMGVIFLLQGAAALFMWWFENRLKID
ncbi:DUF308 domain-containing protein [Clostridium sp. D33t1_170424_F3]|uniref:HdeD family acid-resistance protein n=1 Tax=Clostridium sp. D33t1_170424_F3 TaxID=2787099 RepID=UPI0018AB69B7|nr:DUF308 domain-containing protein [Clostridium sp. D33t1_170424_F3]